MHFEKLRLVLPIFQQLFVNSYRLTALVWQDKKWFVLLLTFVFFALSVSSFLNSGARALLLNELVLVAGSKTVTIYLVWLIVFLLFVDFLPSLLSSVNNYLSHLFWFYLEEKFELDILKKKAHLDVAVHENPAHNDLFNRVNENGTWRIRNFLDRQFFIFQNLLELIIASFILLFSEWFVFLIIFLGTLPELIVEMRYGKQVWGIQSARAEVRRRYWDLSRHFDWLPYLVELKLFQNTSYFLSYVRELFLTFQNEQKRNERKKFIYQLFSSSISYGAMAFATVWFILDVVHGTLLIGTFTFLLSSLVNLRMALGGLFINLGRQYQDSLFVTDFFALFDLQPSLKRPAQGIVLVPHQTPEIVFENVSFVYPHTDTFALKNFSLTISPGEKLAIVGVNGAGKTTLVKLLCRFYDPTEGRIFINGHDLRDIDLESWYYQLGVLFQEYSRYHFLVKEAISIGRSADNFSFDQVQNAARASEADVFIEKWEHGYDQMLGKAFSGGVEPSIGQWQKLALARTFYRDPRVFILDEPTSSIDAEAEAKIFGKLESLSEDKTVLLISHRFSTVRKAHKIVVIEHGELKEYGTHEELLGLDGIYARLFATQAKGYQ